MRRALREADHRDAVATIGEFEDRVDALRRRIDTLERTVAAVVSGKEMCGHRCDAGGRCCCVCVRAFEDKWAPRTFAKTEPCPTCRRRVA